MSEQHSPTSINRQHVVESSIDFLLKQVSNQKLHVANLLAKTGDTESYTYLQRVFSYIEADLHEVRRESLEDIEDYYKGIKND